MDKITIITSLISALLGTGLGFILNFKLGTRKQNLDEFKVILEEYKILAEKNEAKNEKLEKRIQNLEDSKELYLKVELALREEIKELRKQNRELRKAG